MPSLKSAIATVTILGTTVIGCTTAMAAENQSSFVAHYEHNQQVEASLLQKAQASTVTNDKIAALKATVNSINQEIPSLYSSEQAMAKTASTTIPSSDKDKAELTTLKAQHKHLVAELNHNTAEIREYQKRHQTKRLKIEWEERRIIQAKIKLVNLEMRSVNNNRTPWKRAPLDGGLTAIQSVIYDLQTSVIHYTTQWLNETKASIGVPATISGLSYASTSVVIPASGSAAVTDIVAQQPAVKDQNGNVLSNDGAYEISGPANATGVSIDSTIGTVTVEPGATVGTYTVTYAQGSVTETSTLTLVN